MFFLNEALMCLVCKAPQSPEGWNHWGCSSLRRQMFRGQHKNNLFLCSFSLPARTGSQGAEDKGLSDPAEAPTCTSIWFVLCLWEGKAGWERFGNLRKIPLPMNIQIPLLTQMSVSSQHYLPTNSSSKNRKKKNVGVFWEWLLIRKTNCCHTHNPISRLSFIATPD